MVSRLGSFLFVFFSRQNSFYRPLKFLSTFINANCPSGFYEPLGLCFRFASRACLARISASFGLLRHWPNSVISCAIGQALSDDALKRIVCTGKIVDAQRDTVVIAEIKLGKIAMQMFFCTVLIGALHAALEN